MAVVLNRMFAALLNYTLDDLDEIRDAELALVLEKHQAAFSKADLLEIGAGTCRQLQALENTAKLAIGIDIPSSNYHPIRGSKFVYYDGSNLPFGSGSFDVIYSSNTMEHVSDEQRLHQEMRRVLRPNGLAIHVVPSSTWRIWTTIAYFMVLPKIVRSFIRRPTEQAQKTSGTEEKSQRKKSAAAIFLDLLSPQRHGEKGNRFTEWWHFRKASWIRRFGDLGWRVESAQGIGLFYTGYLLATRSRFLSNDARKRLSGTLGSSCLVFVLTPKPTS